MLRVGTEQAGTVLGLWESLPEPWPCSWHRGNARGTDLSSPNCTTTAFDLSVTTYCPLLIYFYCSSSF